MNNKRTQKDFFNEIVALAEANDRFDIVEFAKSRIEAINRKSENKKLTAMQEKNEDIKLYILTALSTGGSDGVTVTEVQKLLAEANEEYTDLSNQKVSALLRALKDEGKVTRFTEGKKTLFKLA